MAQWFAKEEDRIIVQSMDVGNVEVIARIIAQSVALDHYHRWDWRAASIIIQKPCQGTWLVARSAEATSVCDCARQKAKNGSLSCV